MKHTGRWRSSLGLSPFTALIIVSLGTACRDAKKDDAPDAAVAASVRSAEPALAATAAPPPPPDEVDELLDAGGDASADGGAARRRRLIAAGRDAAAVEVVAAVPPPPEPSPEGSRTKRAGATPMGNDTPYGPSAASVAPALKKAPLPVEDPWKKSTPGSPP